MGRPARNGGPLTIEAPTESRGDDRELSAFLREHSGLLKDLLRPYRWMNPEDYEELVSDCMMSMAAAYRGFNPLHPSGATIVTYCRAAITKAVASWLRSRNGPQDVFESAAESLNAPALIDGAETDSLEAGDLLPAAFVDLDLPLMREQALDAVSTPPRREALEMALDGLSGAEIGRMRGYSPQAGWELTKSAISEAKSKLSL